MEYKVKYLLCLSAREEAVECETQLFIPENLPQGFDNELYAEVKILEIEQAEYQDPNAVVCIMGIS